jgi:hypothetical protein
VVRVAVRVDGLEVGPKRSSSTRTRQLGKHPMVSFPRGTLPPSGPSATIFGHPESIDPLTHHRSKEDGDGSQGAREPDDGDGGSGACHGRVLSPSQHCRPCSRRS